MNIKHIKALGLTLGLCMAFTPVFDSMPVQAETATQEASGGLLAGASDETSSVTLNGVSFEAGKTYVVPMALKNASNHSAASAAASCPGKYGEMTVGADGTVTMTMTCRAVSVATITDYAYDYKIYQSKDRTGELTDATVTKLNQNAPKTIDGADSYAPAEIQFEIPAACYDQDGIYISMFVDAMGSAPAAYLQLDYANAKETGDASLNYTTEIASSTVEAFGGYDVTATVTVTDGVITDVTLAGENFEGKYASINEDYLQTAIEGTSDDAGMQAKLIGLYDSDDDAINGLDVVSGATYSSKAIKEAVMNALGIEVQQEVLADAPDTVPDAGLYTISMKNITSVVDHSLAGADQKSTAYLRVDEEGKMWLSYAMVSGAQAAPLYVLGYNGYYLENDGNSELTMDGVTLDTETAQVPTIGTQTIVTDVTVPLKSLQTTYTNNVYLYVDAMKALDGESSGIIFDKGKFNIDTTLTLYWDTLKKVSTQDTAISGLSDGVYKIDGSMMKVNQKDTSMSNNAINHNIMLTVKNGRYYITMNYNSLDVGGIKGYLKDLKYYETGYSTDSNKNPSGTLKDVTVDSWQMYSDGTVLSDSLGTDYPNQITFPLCREFVSGKTDYVPLQVFVPIMDAISAGSGTQDVYLKLDRSTLMKTTADDTAFAETEAPAVKESDEKESEEQKQQEEKKETVPTVKKTYGVKVKNRAKRTALITWKKVSGASGYVIYRSTKKTKGYKAIATVKKGTIVKYTNKKLVKKKTYYYKVRAYRIYNKKKIYGAYSAVKSVKIKK